MHVGIDLRVLDRAGMEQSGLGRYGLELAAGIAAVRPSWTLTLYSNRPQLLPAHLRDRVRTTRWPTASGAGRAAWLHTAAAVQTIGDRPDVWFSPTFVLPAWWRRPSVVTIHDLSFMLLPDRYRGVANARYASAATRLSARQATRVLCGATETKHRLQERLHVAPGKIDVVPYGVSAAFFSDDAPLGDNRPARYLLAVGTFEARKGLEVLHRAVSTLNEDEATIRLILAGQPGWGTDELMNRLRDDPAVEIVLRPSDSELARLYRDAFALVYPSRMEGFGLPVAEAMAARCAVVASDLDCIREFAGNAPLYAPVGDDGSIVRHVRTLLGDEAERSQRVEAGARAAAVLRWEAVAEATALVIERAAAGRRTGGAR